ncbi:16541_t:CDS:2 [Gigaspora rosea]|nr:16541_t:CDS:2 [Gigaspora rosea]
MIIFTYTNALAKNFREKRNIKAQTWHSFFRQNGVGEWISECMEEKKFPQVVIWDEIVCCGDDTQSLPFFGEMLHNWLKEYANYYEEVLTNYHAKCSKIATQKCLELHRIKYPDPLVPLIYRPKDGHKQNCLIPIPGSSEKQELVKNDIIYLPLNTLPEKFIKDILIEEKILDWDLEYAMTFIWIEGPPLPPEIEEAKNMKAIEHSLRPFISEKLVGYMDQDKKKGREFDLFTVDRIDNQVGHIKEKLDRCHRKSDINDNEIEPIYNNALITFDELVKVEICMLYNDIVFSKRIRNAILSNIEDYNYGNPLDSYNFGEDIFEYIKYLM